MGVDDCQNILQLSLKRCRGNNNGIFIFFTMPVVARKRWEIGLRAGSFKFRINKVRWYRLPIRIGSAYRSVYNLGFSQFCIFLFLLNIFNIICPLASVYILSQGRVLLTFSVNR